MADLRRHRRLRSIALLQGAPGKDGYDAADLEAGPRLAAWAEGRPPADAAVLAGPP